MFKKVIRSHLGEVTQDSRTVGDRIRYRIYYGSQSAPFNPETTIVDELDPGLDDIVVLNDGVYDETKRIIRWTVPGLRFKKNAYVEFEAELKDVGVVKNQAGEKGTGLHLERSNVVQTRVTAHPPEGWIPLMDDVALGERPRSYMKDETTSGLTVRFDVPGIFIHEEKVEGVTYQHISIPGRAATAEVGKPELPILGEIIEVPFGVNFTPHIVKAETIELAGYNVYPAQEPRLDRTLRRRTLTPLENPIGFLHPPLIKVAQSNPFKLDPLTYSTDGLYPNTPVDIDAEEIGIIRGHRVLLLKVNPVQVNPVTRTLTVFKTIEVHVSYDRPGQIQGIDERLLSRDFEEMLAGMILNYKPHQRFFEINTDKEKYGCDYLILTHDAFYNDSDAANPVLRLANWKRQKGYRVRVTKVGDITGGNTADSIETYIQNAYDTWNPAPSYVLLIGDADLLRAHEGSHHPGEHSVDSPQPQIQSDLFYVDVDGTDYFPDIYIGRMSADTLQQVTDMVDKILNYEKNPPAAAAYYDNTTLVGLFTETDENPPVHTGQEDRPWIANLEAVRAFMDSEGYTVERIYNTDTGFPGNATAQAPLRFHDGTNLPNDLLHPQYGWNLGTNDIVNALDNGRFMMSYRGHGHWSGLAEPRFGIAAAQNLQQNDMPTFLTCITCQAGWFDNETDDDTHGGRNVGDDCFTEVLLRRPRSGAVGILSMVRNSWTGCNDFLLFGVYKAIWPNFDPDPAWSNHPAIPQGEQASLRKLGQICHFSKMWMARACSADDTRRYEFEMHHLYGEPETTLWISAPGDLEADYPYAVGAVGRQDFVVKVTDKASGQPVANATVVFTRDDKIFDMQQTRTDGLALFNWIGAGDGDLELTITALDYRPYEGKLVITVKGAELNLLDPDDGPEGQVIHVGGRNFKANESIKLFFGSNGPHMVTADASGEFGQGLPTVDLTVPAAYPHGLVNITASGMTSGRRAARVFQVRDEKSVDLWTYDPYNSATWSVHPGDNPTWNSPDIQLYDANNNPVDSSSLVLGDTYTVKVNVRNSAAFPAQNASIVFKWENFGAGGPWQPLATVPADISANPPGVTEVQTTFQPHATGHLCLQVNLEHLEDIDATNNCGQENLHVGYSSSPAEACFTVWNLTKQAAPVFFEVRQLATPQNPHPLLWASKVKHPDPQFIPPGERAEACVIVDPDKADVPKGTQAEFAVTCFIGRQMIGGVNLTIIKKA